MRLSTLFPTLKATEREELAAKAGTKAVYLAQLATRFKGKKPSLDLLAKLAKADRRLTLQDMVAEFSEEPQSKLEPQSKVA